MPLTAGAAAVELMSKMATISNPERTFEALRARALLRVVMQSTREGEISFEQTTGSATLQPTEYADTEGRSIAAVHTETSDHKYGRLRYTSRIGSADSGLRQLTLLCNTVCAMVPL